MKSLHFCILASCLIFSNFCTASKTACAENSLVTSETQPYQSSRRSLIIINEERLPPELEAFVYSQRQAKQTESSVVETPPESSAASKSQTMNTNNGVGVVVWAGADFTSDSYYTYAGAVKALSAQDIYTEDGLLLRVSVGHGDYSYNIPAGTVDGTVSVSDLMLGYKKAFSNGGLTAYLGGSVEHHKLSANDAGNSVNGTHSGFAANVDAQFKVLGELVLQGLGSYASANESYWSHFTASHPVSLGDSYHFTVGPTAGFSGGKNYQIKRAGLAFADMDIGFANAYAYTGYAWYNNGDDGMYYGLGLGRGF